MEVAEYKKVTCIRSELQQCQRELLDSRKSNVAKGFPDIGFAPFIMDDYCCKVCNKTMALSAERVFSEVSALETFCKECPNRGENYESVLEKCVAAYVKVERAGGQIATYRLT